MRALHYLLIVALLCSLLVNISLVRHFKLKLTDLPPLVSTLLPQELFAWQQAISQSQTQHAKQTTPTGSSSTRPVLSTTADNANSNNNDPALSRQLIQALQQQDYRLAADVIEQASQLSPEQVAMLKAQWLKDLERLIANDEFLLAEKSINAYLEYQFDDIDLLTFKVTLALAQQDPSSAIKHAYNLEFYLFTNASRQESIRYARTIAEQEIQELQQQRLWQHVIELIEDAQQYDPSFEPYQWQLANALFQRGEYQTALEKLQPLLTTSNYQAEAQRLRQQIEQKRFFVQSDSIKIPLTVAGKHFLVNATINQTDTVELLIDTGASSTTISQQTFASLTTDEQISFIKEQTFNTAGGPVSSPVYQLAEFSVDRVSLRNFQVAVNHQLNEHHSDGLLGMDFLGQFIFYIDPEEQVLHLLEK